MGTVTSSVSDSSDGSASVSSSDSDSTVDRLRNFLLLV